MRVTIKVPRSPNGFLGGLPGPSVWKQLRRAHLAKLKSMFRKSVSRVSCSSCPAWIHVLSLDVSQKIRAPTSKININHFRDKPARSITVPRIELSPLCFINFELRVTSNLFPFLATNASLRGGSFLGDSARTRNKFEKKSHPSLSTNPTA
jgi:hypothetical protein